MGATPSTLTLSSDNDHTTSPPVDYVDITGNVATLKCDPTTGLTPFRDNFPDCFFGDELHFSVTYTAEDTSDPRARINSWYSTVA